MIFFTHLALLFVQKNQENIFLKNIFLFYFSFSSCIKEALSNWSAVNNRWINYSKLPLITKGLPHIARVFPQTLFFIKKKKKRARKGRRRRFRKIRCLVCRICSHACQSVCTWFSFLVHRTRDTWAIIASLSLLSGFSFIFYFFSFKTIRKRKGDETKTDLSLLIVYKIKWACPHHILSVVYEMSKSLFYPFIVLSFL